MALLSHLDLPVELIMMEPGKFDAHPELASMNPNAKVPTLKDDDNHVWESSTILRYLAEKAGSDLWPKDVAQQRDVAQWQFWEACHFGPALLGVFYERVLKVQFNRGEPDQAVIDEKLGFSNRFLKVLDGQLAKHDFVVGQKPTIADFSIGAIAVTCDESGIDLSPYAHVQVWLKRMNQLKGWDEATPSMETKMAIAA